MTRFIDFYKSQNHIPTHQQETAQVSLGERRAALYRDLGLPIHLLSGKKIIEFGPGGGYNAAQILKFSPRVYHFVDGMDPELAVLETNLKDGRNLGTGIEFFQSLFLEFTSDIKYDVVIAEACIPGQDEPLRVLEKISEFVAPDGFLIITNTSKSSLLSEILRSVIGKWLSRQVRDEDELKDKCTELFRGHLDSLKTTTRNARDWVLDNIVHEWHLGKSDFSFTEAAELLFTLNFQYHGGSPSFYRDFTWYKDSNKGKVRSSQEVINQYQEIELLLLDYRVSLSQFLDLSTSQDLTDLLSQIEITFDSAKRFLISGEDSFFDELLTKTRSLSEALESDFNLTYKALLEFSNFPEYLGEKDLQSQFPEFKSWWGRGQQYNCFQKI